MAQDSAVSGRCLPLLHDMQHRWMLSRAGWLLAAAPNTGTMVATVHHR
jgi:hypothetical protein